MVRGVDTSSSGTSGIFIVAPYFYFEIFGVLGTDRLGQEYSAEMLNQELMGFCPNMRCSCMVKVSHLS